jgi:PAS domain S-box-containing protein
MAAREESDQEAQLVEAVLAALDGDSPEESLDAGLEALRDQRLAEREGTGNAWLELRRGQRELRLFAAPGGEAPGPRARALLTHALGAALARKAEQCEARKQAERLELIRKASFEGIVIHDQGVVVECNDRLCEIVGYTREEVLDPAQLARVVAPEDLVATQERISSQFEGEFVITCVRRDGTRLRAECCTKQTHLGDRPFRVVALRDVTQRERTAELLRESEARLRSILEATFDGVVFTRNGILVDANEGAERFLGFSREQLIGRSVLEVVAPASRGAVSQRIRDQIVGEYEAMAQLASGEVVPVMLVIVPSTINGEPVRVAAVRDLRAARRLEQERRQLELQVERSQRLESLGVLASGIAHDFNNLLVGVLGGAEMLLTTLQEPDDRLLAEGIRTAGQRAASLTKQMLAYAGRRSLTTTEPVDLAELWQELRACSTRHSPRRPRSSSGSLQTVSSSANEPP